MPELFLELFSEEIPARMQARAAEDLARLAAEALAALSPSDVRTFYGPRRIALAAEVAAQVAAASTTERGPRANAPEQALTGFLRKHNASREQLRQEGAYWVLEKSSAAVPAGSLIAGVIPPLLRRFPWPKSMRWGGSSSFVWVRPLRRIVCLLEGVVVPFDLRDGEDDGHGLAAGNLTEGHRFMAPGAVAVASVEDWSATLHQRRVLVDADDRKRLIADGIAALAAERQIAVVDDPGLLDEVAGLVEWPLPLLGRIDDAYMDLPPEVRQVSMRVNQRYFAFRNPDGSAAPWFGFVDNIEPVDGGLASTAGNERVLRARFADARHFWDLDRRARLESRVPLLDNVTFHARLGSQGERVRRLERLAEEIAPLVGAGPALARDAARLAKADLVTGMVGEFPELQGVMGRYYALHDGEDPFVADAIRDHYAPKGPNDAVPMAAVSVAVALADKLDLLVGFFAIGERPSGAGDPYALRRAALGIIRIMRENGLRLNLLPLITLAGEAWHHRGVHPLPPEDVLNFLAERLRVQLRGEGARHDVLTAIFAAHPDDDIVRLVARTEALAQFLGTSDGSDLLLAYRRAANISRIEQRKGGPSDDAVDAGLIRLNEEDILARQVDFASARMRDHLEADRFADALSALATLREPVDAFFEQVTVNAPEPELRLNRLRLLNRLCTTMRWLADFSRIEG
ncbi:MAG TPA: glycine--tRNA ligase subunit beta [Acetobacteraceae bacterium]|nr:glycine--tRNA ligase subunit beta [Acetobacteraceae bacterium]